MLRMCEFFCRQSPTYIFLCSVNHVLQPVIRLRDSQRETKEVESFFISRVQITLNRHFGNGPYLLDSVYVVLLSQRFPSFPVILPSRGEIPRYLAFPHDRIPRNLALSARPPPPPLRDLTLHDTVHVSREYPCI